MEFTNRIPNIRTLTLFWEESMTNSLSEPSFLQGRIFFLQRFSDDVIIVTLRKYMVNKKGVKTCYIIHIPENNG